MNKKCELILKELENEGKLNVWWDFNFPEKEELKLRLKDILEDEVDEKYYLSDEQVKRIKLSTYNVSKTRIQEKDYCDTETGKTLNVLELVEYLIQKIQNIKQEAFMIKKD